MLLLVNGYYAPDVASSGQHLTDLAEHLSAHGIPVEVVTGGAAYVERGATAPRSEIRGGVRIRRIALPNGPRASIARRVMTSGIFLLRASWIVGTRRGVEGVIVLTTPPLLPTLAWCLRVLRGRRYGVWSLDLYPDAAMAAGVVRADGWLARPLRWLGDRGYRSADFIVGLGPQMTRRIVARGVAPERVHTIPIWALAGSERAAESGAAESSRDATRRRYGVEGAGRFVVLYAGNAGIVHDFAPILEAMRLLRDHPAPFFLFVGGGPRRREIEAFARRAGLSNFAYHDYVPRSELAELLSAGDAHLVSLRQGFAGISVPGKVYAAMAAERPVLFVGPADSEAADAVRTAACGVVIDPAEPGPTPAAERIAAAIRAWCDAPALAQAAGLRGYAAQRDCYARDVSCAAFERVVRGAWPTAGAA